MLKVLNDIMTKNNYFAGSNLTISDFSLLPTITSLDVSIWAVISFCYKLNVSGNGLRLIRVCKFEEMV